MRMKETERSFRSDLAEEWIVTLEAHLMAKMRAGERSEGSVDRGVRGGCAVFEELGVERSGWCLRAYWKLAEDVVRRAEARRRKRCRGTALQDGAL
jgi:hypothetical protein